MDTSDLVIWYGVPAVIWLMICVFAVYLALSSKRDIFIALLGSVFLTLLFSIMILALGGGSLNQLPLTWAMMLLAFWWIALCLVAVETFVKGSIE